ncbi:MAG: hypothetical protein K0R27_329 [Xanthobacteraceae bacterium]|jgi:DNA-directed RNA polymerase subunit RPC12/RpoP|nr:hypothetical protein [Xanthobacteraceae bacterium]
MLVDEIICVACLMCPHRTWLRRSEAGLTTIDQLRRRLRCKECGSKAVRMERPQHIDPEDLTYLVATQFLPTSPPETVTRSKNIIIARAAFDAACREFPRQRVYLAHGIRIIADSRNPPPEAAE